MFSVVRLNVVMLSVVAPTLTSAWYYYQLSLMRLLDNMADMVAEQSDQKIEQKFTQYLEMYPKLWPKLKLKVQNIHTQLLLMLK
jgi:hypothetical protein